MGSTTFVITPVDNLLEFNAYATIEYGNNYFDTKLNSDAWSDASVDDKSKALTMATRAIDRLDYIGRPTQVALDAGNQFPRGMATDNILDPLLADTEVPEDVKIACCEEALSLLSGADPDENLTNTRISSEAYSSVRTNYDGPPLPHEMSGITSPSAWRLLFPYIRDRRNIELRRI